jgi:hypothetical protein
MHKSKTPLCARKGRKETLRSQGEVKSLHVTASTSATFDIHSNLAQRGTLSNMTYGQSGMRTHKYVSVVRLFP